MFPPIITHVLAHLIRVADLLLRGLTLDVLALPDAWFAPAHAAAGHAPARSAPRRRAVCQARPDGGGAWAWPAKPCPPPLASGAELMPPDAHADRVQRAAPPRRLPTAPGLQPVTACARQRALAAAAHPSAHGALASEPDSALKLARARRADAPASVPHQPALRRSPRR